MPPSQPPLKPYDSLPANDGDNGSISDDEDSEEKHFLRDGRSKHQKRGTSSAMRSYRWVLEAILVVIVVLLLADRFLTSRQRPLYEGAGDITGFAPRFAQKITTFRPNPLFIPSNASDFWSEAVHSKWLSIVPKGLGYLQIPDPQKYTDLPTRLTNYTADQYVVTTSMTHQLHCLYAIAESYAALRSGGESRMPGMAWHLDHCFDYIRQGIMCCGDVALEGAQTTFAEDVDGSDGWDAKHVCKDYDQVSEYLERNAVDDMLWI